MHLLHCVWCVGISYIIIISTIKIRLISLLPKSLLKGIMFIQGQSSLLMETFLISCLDDILRQNLPSRHFGKQSDE